MMNIVDVLLNAGSGGIIGALASIGTGIVSIFQSKNQFVHDEKMAAINLDLTKLQGQFAKELEEAKFKSLIESDNSTAFTASQVSANQSTIPWIDGSVKLWRMFLTIFLMSMTSYFYYATQDMDMKKFIIAAIVDLTGICVGWFFGSRQMEKFIASKPA